MIQMLTSVLWRTDDEFEMKSTFSVEKGPSQEPFYITLLLHVFILHSFHEPP